MSARLRKMLASRGVDPTLNDDIVQEVAVRALDKRVPFTDPADLYRWAATTARRIHIDHLRCDGRTTYDDVLVGVADSTDVAHAAERRVALGHVLRALADLRPTERAAILDSLEDREARTSQALVRRHRARATLKKAVGGAIALAGLARLRLRVASPAMKAAGATAVMAPALVLGGTLLVTPARPAPPERPVRVAPPAAGDATARAARPARRPEARPLPAPTPRADVTVAAAVAVPDRAAGDPAREPTRVGPVTYTHPPREENKGSHVCYQGFAEVCAPPVKHVPRRPAR